MSNFASVCVPCLARNWITILCLSSPLVRERNLVFGARVSGADCFNWTVYLTDSIDRQQLILFRNALEHTAPGGGGVSVWLLGTLQFKFKF